MASVMKHFTGIRGILNGRMYALLISKQCTTLTEKPSSALIFRINSTTEGSIENQLISIKHISAALIKARNDSQFYKIGFAVSKEVENLTE